MDAFVTTPVVVYIGASFASIHRGIGMEHRFAKRCAWVVFALCAATLLAWMLVGPVLVSVKPPALLLLYPMTALSLALSALALAAAAGGWPRTYTRVSAGLVVLLASLFLVETGLGLKGGIEAVFAPDAPSHADIPWRPSPQTALGLLLLGLAQLVASIHRSERIDAGDLMGATAVLLPFAVVLGYLFEANALYGSAQGTASPLAAVMLLLLSIGVIAAQNRGLMSAFTAQTAGAIVGRRLLPWVITLPIFFGWLEIWSVRNGLLELPLALALTVSASIAAFIGLIYWVANMMSGLEARQAAQHVERESQAKEEGMTDALTGLLNRRGWERHLKLEEEVCQRERRNGCVVMIDLDDLKKVNDTQGHTQGDELIKRAARALRDGARSGDILARLGGDEFAYLAIGCQPEHAGVVVRRLAESMMKNQVGASLGYAMRDINVNLQGAFDEADRSMYANKRARKAKRAMEAART